MTATQTVIGGVICAHEIQFHAPCMIDGGIIQAVRPLHNLLLRLRDECRLFFEMRIFISPRFLRENNKGLSIFFMANCKNKSKGSYYKHVNGCNDDNKVCL